MVTNRNLSLILAASLATAVLGGCRGGISTEPPVHLNLDMDFQPKLKAQSESSFAGWSDHRGMRRPVEGTVSRAQFIGDPATLVKNYDRDGDGALDRGEAANLMVANRRFTLGDRDGDDKLDAAEVAGIAAMFTYKNDDGTFIAQNPLPATDEVLERGRERFNINCSVCHGVSGTGGLVAKRWPAKVPSLVNDVDEPTRLRLAAMPPGELVSVITEGKGTMPSYAHQIRVEDRWAIVHYLKALQKHFN